jgi:hypothetical protein
MTASGIFALLAVTVTSLDYPRTLFVQELMAAIGAEEFYLLVPQLQGVAIELSLALRAGHPKNFRHGSSWRQMIFTTETPSSQSRNIS